MAPLKSKPVALTLTSPMALPAEVPARIGKSLRASLDAALAQIPDEKRGALLVAATPAGVQAIVATRFASAWEIGAWVETGWRLKPHSAGVVVRKTW